MKHIHPKQEKAALIARLRRINGQIQGIEKMVQADTDCSEVLMQVLSARQALKGFGDRVIHSHMHDCIEKASSRAESHEKLRAFLTVLERYVG